MITFSDFIARQINEDVPPVPAHLGNTPQADFSHHYKQSMLENTWKQAIEEISYEVSEYLENLSGGDLFHNSYVNFDKIASQEELLANVKSFMKQALKQMP